MNKRELGNLTVNIMFHYLLITLIAISSILTVHLKLKPFECPECGKGCSKRNNLKRHIESVLST